MEIKTLQSSLQQHSGVGRRLQLGWSLEQNGVEKMALNYRTNACDVTCKERNEIIDLDSDEDSEERSIVEKLYNDFV